MMPFHQQYSFIFLLAFCICVFLFLWATLVLPGCGAVAIMQNNLSNNERQFMRQALKQKQRVDGRALFQCRRTKFTFDRSDNECQVEVQFGRTRVLGVVSATIMQPYDDRPTEGFVNVFVSLSPMADPSFADSKFSAYTIEIRSILEGLLNDGNAMDFEALCIVAGEKVRPPADA